VDFDDAGVRTATIYERALLEPEMTLEGPAIIEEPATTIVVFPEQPVRVDQYGNLHIELDRR
jgi:N-methylhydantoinase A